MDGVQVVACLGGSFNAAGVMLWVMWLSTVVGVEVFGVCVIWMNGHCFR